MKRYGIRTTSKDSTPGFRGTDIIEDWYPTESERDIHYEYLTRKTDPRAEFMANKGISNECIDDSYEKIEMECD